MSVHVIYTKPYPSTLENELSLKDYLSTVHHSMLVPMDEKEKERYPRHYALKTHMEFDDDILLADGTIETRHAIASPKTFVKCSVLLRQWNLYNDANRRKCNQFGKYVCFDDIETATKRVRKKLNDSKYCIGKRGESDYEVHKYIPANGGSIYATDYDSFVSYFSYVYKDIRDSIPNNENDSYWIVKMCYNEKTQDYGDFRKARLYRQTMKRLDLESPYKDNGDIDRDKVINSKVITSLDVIDIENFSLADSPYDLTCSRPQIIYNKTAVGLSRAGKPIHTPLGDMPYIMYKFYYARNKITSVADFESFYVELDNVHVPLFVVVPCGHCFYCKQTKAAVLSQEIQYSYLYHRNKLGKDNSCFVTCTYAGKKGLQNIDSDDFKRFIHDIRDFFNPKRMERNFSFTETLNQFRLAAALRDAKTPKERRNAYLKYPPIQVHVSKDKGLIGQVFRDPQLLDQIRNFDYIGCSEYGSKKGRSHFHCVMLGLPTLFFTHEHTALYNPDDIRRDDVKVKDELVALFQHFWPHGALDCESTYGKPQDIGRYIGKYVSKTVSNIGNRTVPCQIYRPNKVIGIGAVKEIVPAYICNMGVKEYLYTYCCNTSYYGVNVKMPSFDMVRSLDKSLSVILPIHIREYIASAYEYAKEHDSTMFGYMSTRINKLPLSVRLLLFGISSRFYSKKVAVGDKQHFDIHDGENDVIYHYKKVSVYREKDLEPHFCSVFKLHDVEVMFDKLENLIAMPTTWNPDENVVDYHDKLQVMKYSRPRFVKHAAASRAKIVDIRIKNDEKRKSRYVGDLQ